MDRIQNQVERASGLYNIPMKIFNVLGSTHNSLRLLTTEKEDIIMFISSGCHIPKHVWQLYLDYQFSLTKIGEIFWGIEQDNPKTIHSTV